MSLPDNSTYHAKLVKWGTGESKEKKTPYIFLEFDVTHLADQGQWVDIDPFVRTTPFIRTVTLYLSDQAWPYTKEKLERLGFNGAFDESMNFADEPKTAGVELWMRYEEYQGKQRDKWDLAGGGGGFEHAPPAKEVVRKFAAKWRAEIGAKPNGRPASPPTAAKPAAARTGAVATAAAPSPVNGSEEGYSTYDDPNHPDYIPI